MFDPISIGAGVLGSKVLGGLLGGGGGSSAAAADPFGPYRGQYAQLLNKYWANPELAYADPSFVSGSTRQQHQLASQLAAQGLLNSGTGLAALADASNQYSRDYLNDKINQLMTLSGASSNNSVEAARLAANQQAAQQQRSSQLLGLGGSMLGNYLAGPGADAKTSGMYSGLGYLTGSILGGGL